MVPSPIPLISEKFRLLIGRFLKKLFTLSIDISAPVSTKNLKTLLECGILILTRIA